MNKDQLTKITTAPGFIAALDQSGGSTPNALASYGIGSESFSSEVEMFDLVHEMRSRVITSPSFGGDRVIGAVLFEMTMDRTIEDLPTCEFLWDRKQIVPFLKVDKGLADPINGAQLMKPNPGLGDLLTRALSKGVFGTKMRSVILEADHAGVAAVVAQQFEIANQILDCGLVPIIEPEVSISCPDKARAERLLKTELVTRLDQIPKGAHVMFKLTLPEVDNHYELLVDDPRVLRVAALSGGYHRDEATARLARNNGVIASFSRALAEGLAVDQTAAEFDGALDLSISEIYRASTT